MELKNLSIKTELLSLFTKLITSNPYISLTLLKILYVVIPKRIMRKYLPF
jgi:hypothetical protein